LAARPAAGELHDALNALVAKTWRHPFTGLEVRFGCSRLEQWYYAAKKAEAASAKMTARHRRNTAPDPLCHVDRCEPLASRLPRHRAIALLLDSRP